MIIQALNLLIMHETGAEKSFDDVLRQLWADYKKDPDKGYTEDEFRQTVESVAGTDLGNFFKKHIYGKVPVDYAQYFNYAGLDLKDTSIEEIHLGMTIKWQDGKLMVKTLDKNYGAYAGGLNVNDEIIAIDGYRAKSDYKRLYEHKHVGDSVKVMVSRQGMIEELEFC